MKNLSTLLVLLALVLTGCANEEKEAFERKQECIEYKSDIEQTLEKNSSLELARNRLDEIFYSPKLNTCLYTYKRSFTNFKTLGYDLNIVDYLSNMAVWSQNSTVEPNIEALFKEEVKYYKEK